MSEEFVLALLSNLITLSCTGVFAGILAGLLGVGGGIVIVPVLYFVFQQMGVSASSAMAIATATSLLTIIPTSLSSIRAHHRKGNIDWSLIKRWSPFMLTGVIVGSLLVTKINGQVFAALFGIIAVLVSFNMMFRASAPPVAQSLPSTLGQCTTASVIGFFSVMIGIGGGTLGVPTLTAFNVAAHRAVGTAAAFGLLIALPGATTMLLTSQTPADAPEGTWRLVNWLGFVCIVPLTVVFAPIGANLGAKLNPTKLKQIFALILAITGVRMLLQSVGV